MADARPATPDDIDGLLELHRSWEARIYGEPRTTREMLAAHCPTGGGFAVDGPEGALEGYAAVDSGGGLEVWARPGAGYGEVGAALIEAAAASRPGRLETVAPAWAADLCELLEAAGFRRIRDVLEMRAELGSNEPEPRWPAGVVPRPFDAVRDAQEVHACLVEAFAGSDERVAPYEEWRPWLLGDPSYDPGLVFVAEAGGAVAGVAQCWTEGFVKDLAVRPAYRGRGLGEALLRAAFAELSRRGRSEVRLKVDDANPTGAVRLYRRVGMEELRRYALYARG